MKTTNGIRYLFAVFCLGTGLSSASAHAAKVQIHSQSLLPGFSQLSNELESVAEALGSRQEDLQVVSARLQLKVGEKLTQALKQTLFVHGAREGGYQIPDHVLIAPAKSRNLQQARNILKALGAMGKDLEVYSYSAGNTFGECWGLVFTQASSIPSTIDATFIGACQSE
jgi:hypothetical protein